MLFFLKSFYTICRTNEELKSYVKLQDFRKVVLIVAVSPLVLAAIVTQLCGDEIQDFSICFALFFL